MTDETREQKSTGAILAAKEGELNPRGDGRIAEDGVDRRGFLKCMAWAGTGVLWSFAGGIPTSRLLAQEGVLYETAGFTWWECR
jgi:hypothetical protein